MQSQATRTIDFCKLQKIISNSNLFYFILMHRYSIPRSKLPSSISLEEYKQNYIQPIQFRVYNVLKYWIEQSFADFNDKMIENLQDFISVFRMEGPPKLADQLTAILNKNVRISFSISIH